MCIHPLTSSTTDIYIHGQKHGIIALTLLIPHLNTKDSKGNTWTLPGVTSVDELTTHHVVNMWIKLPGVTGCSRLADSKEWVHPEDVGLPRYFVSHAWKGRWVKLMNTVESFLSNASGV